MRAATKLVTKVGAAALIALAAWAAAIGPAEARPSWSYLTTGDLPAYVRAMKFRTGNVLEAGHGMCWGNWCVSFGSEPPVANYMSMSGPLEGMGINIKGLECRNPVAGYKPCFMVFMTMEPWTEEGNYTSCSIGGDDVRQIDIRCPTDLILE